MGFFSDAFNDLTEFSWGNDAIFGQQFLGITDEWRNGKPPSNAGPDAYQWDPETGLPIGLTEAPQEDVALAFQWRAKELTRQRNAALRREAMGYLQQGQRQSETFRRGGYANANWFAARANLAMQSQVDEPDLLINWRDARSERAQLQYEQSQSRAQMSNLLSTAGTVIGAIYGGGAGAAAGGAIGGALGGQVGQGGEGGRRETVTSGNEPRWD